MKALLDTHAFLWWNTDDPALSTQARAVIADGRNEIYLSAASVWEIVIKSARGRLLLPSAPAVYIHDRMRLNRFHPLPILIQHAIQVDGLPAYHQDPFDRLLIAQSQVEGMALITGDKDIQQYRLETIW
jgi:PIN domain nuclease of toxin-antitoxin system